MNCEYSEQLRAIVAAHGRLVADVGTLGDDSDLYAAGLTSLSTVNLMLALEEHFDVEFLDRMLARKTFQSIGALSAAISELRVTRRASTSAPPAEGLRGAA